MSWPALDQSVKVLDHSVYQKDPDYAALKAAEPAIAVVIHRLANVYLTLDADFYANFNNAEAAGFDNAVYVNVNPSLSVQKHIDAWKGMLGARRPKALIYDAETSAGLKPTAITPIVRGCYDMGLEEWPDAAHAYYTADWWWTPNIVHGWESGYYFGIAHYPFIVQETDGSWRVAQRYSEVDPHLPIGNTFTPKLPPSVPPDRVIWWQLSSSGRFTGIWPDAPSDFGYLKKWWYDKVWTEPSGGNCDPEVESALRAEADTLRLTSKQLADQAASLTEQADEIDRLLG